MQAESPSVLAIPSGKINQLLPASEMRPFYTVSILFIIALAFLTGLYLSGKIAPFWILVPAVLYIGLLIAGSVFIRWNFYFISQHKGNNKSWIALSFDDGPALETGIILDVLKKHGIPAAFFSIGKNAEKYPELVKRWLQEGHVIGNHSYQHGLLFDLKSASVMVLEIERTNAVIQKITGKKPLLFRPPYGVCNPNLKKAIQKTGMISVGWSVRSFDTSARDKEQLLTRLLKKTRGGDIVLLHDNMEITCEILTEFIIHSQRKGFTFVSLEKMLDIKAYA